MNEIKKYCFEILGIKDIFIYTHEDVINIEVALHEVTCRLSFIKWPSLDEFKEILKEEYCREIEYKIGLYRGMADNMEKRLENIKF